MEESWTLPLRTLRGQIQYGRKLPKKSDVPPYLKINHAICKEIFNWCTRIFMLLTESAQFIARDVIYTSCAYATMSVSVCL